MLQPDQWPTSRLLSTAARMVEHAWNERLASIGVTHAGVTALDVLDSHPPMSQARLAALVRVQAQTMGKTLHRLQLHGHVKLQRDAQDRRSHEVTITDAGRQALTAARNIESELLPGDPTNTAALRDQLVDIVTQIGNARWQSGATPTERTPAAG